MEQVKQFFIKIWNSFTGWFIEGRGWANVLGAVAAVVLGLILIKIILSAVRRIVRRSKIGNLAGNFITTVLKIVLLFIYLIAILHILGVDTSGLVAVLAASSLAITLAMQEILSNFASGMVLVSNHPFEEGDYVEVGNVAGTVVNIKMFSTTLRTPDNKIIAIPNSNVATNNIINYSALPKRRLDLNFGVAYGTDIEFAKSVIADVFSKHAKILHEDGYTIRLNQQAESALVFTCRCYVKSAEYWDVYFDLMENVTKRFVKEGIEIPYNKLDVTLLNKSEEKKEE